MNDWQEMVLEFHRKFSLPEGIKPQFLEYKRWRQRKAWVDEEVKETETARWNEDLPETADGIIDQLYFLIGTAVEMGIDLDPLFREVHRKNMMKVAIPGQTKIGKPEGWTPPDIGALLRVQGWQP